MTVPDPTHELKVLEGNLDDAAVSSLLMEHLRHMASLSPPESVHALGTDDLRDARVTFWSFWKSGDLAGCAALKQLDRNHGEIKSMRTSANHLRQGIAAKMLTHVMDQATARGYRRLSLETGSMDAFNPARVLYERFGFEYCEPFADYVLDPNSVFMTKTL